MRITGGDKRGFVMLSPKGKGIRPSSDHIRQVIFNVLGHDLSKRRVLDLFSGTGILGIEALSRGAEYACFVDKSSASLRLIRRNLEITGYKDRASVIRMDLIKGFLRLKQRFDIVFIDPPYNTGLLLKTLGILPVKDILQDNATIIGRSSKRESIPCNINGMGLQDLRGYGDTRLWIYRYEGRDEGEDSYEDSYISGNI